LKTDNISKAQIEVWEWKEKAAADVENIDLKEALDISLMNSVKIMEKLGLKPTKHIYSTAENLHMAVSDNSEEYNYDSDK
jgi:hypothetical protein